MAITRQRSVTPDAFLSPKLLRMPPETRLMEIGLRLYADNYGREMVDAGLLRAAIFPLNRDIQEAEINRMLWELDEAGAMVLYDVSGESYYQLTEWPAVQHPGPRSRHPEPPEDSHEPFMNASRGSHGEGEGERVRAGESARGSGGGFQDQAHAPSPFCEAHRATGGTDQACRGCGRARLQRKVYDDEQMGGVRFEPDE